MWTEFWNKDGKKTYAVINAKNEADTIRKTVVHETFHDLNGIANYKALVEEAYNKSVEIDRQAVEERTKQYKEQFPDMTEQAIKEEIAADYFGKELSGEETFSETFAYKYKSFWARAKTFVTSLASRVRGKDTFTHKEVNAVGELFDSLMRNNNIAYLGNGIRYKLEDFSKQVDQVVDGTFNVQFDLYVSETPKVLLDIGFPNKPLLMLNSKIKDILSKHSEMSVDLIKQIPKAVKTPLLILKSKTHPTESVVIISEINTEKGKMIIPVWINQEGTYIDVEVANPVFGKTNFVASAYGRNLRELLNYAKENEGFYYVNNNKTKEVRELFSTHGLQLSAPLKISNFNTIISNPTKNSNTFAENQKIFRKI